MVQLICNNYKTALLLYVYAKWKRIRVHVFEDVPIVIAIVTLESCYAFDTKSYAVVFQVYDVWQARVVKTMMRDKFRVSP